MNERYNDSYREAGVDVTAGYRAVELMKKHVARTTTPGVLEGIGGFGGLFAPDLTGMARPVLVSGTDGVGTKLKLAFTLNRHNTIGIDCVAMCVNDIICAGARPLFFLDYLALGRNTPEKVAEIVAGVAEGCVQAGCALVGGETAEMPGFYPPDEYDLAGFAVGIVDEAKIIDRSAVRPGDALIGLASSGVHSNGFSLIRKIFGEDAATLNAHVPELGMSLGDCLLTPTRIYVKPVLELLPKVAVNGIAHITGGGFFENLPRMLPEGMGVKIEEAALPKLPIFDYIEKTGNLPHDAMYATYNMGIGLCIAVRGGDADAAVAALAQLGERAYIIGEVTDSAGVSIC